MNDDHGNRKTGEVLLVLHVAVHREKKIELRRCERQEPAVLDTGPAGLSNSRDFVAMKIPTQATRDALVK